MLQGEPLTPFEARLLGLDPALSVQVDALDAATRRSVRNRELVLGVGLVVLLAPLGAALAYYLLWILQRINQELRLELFQRLQRLSLRFHQDSRVGDAIYRLYQDSAMVTDLIQTVLLSPLGEILRFASAHGGGRAARRASSPCCCSAPGRRRCCSRRSSRRGCGADSARRARATARSPRRSRRRWREPA